MYKLKMTFSQWHEPRFPIPPIIESLFSTIIDQDVQLVVQQTSY